MSGRPASVSRYGERALLAQFDGRGARPAEWAQAVLAASRPGVLDAVPAERSVLLHLDDAGARDRAALQSWLGTLDLGDAIPAEAVAAAERRVADLEIPVRYDGADLAEVGERTGLGADGVIEAHTGTLWRVAFCGFAPGFGYLVPDAGPGSPDDPVEPSGSALAVPRRPTPRPQVPAGSVALAAGYSAVYPRASPGGWQLIGRTDRPLWDLAADPPTPMRPGALVRFREVLT